jgi:serine phosphatase RsbU (regulator of sigma subunit)
VLHPRLDLAREFIPFREVGGDYYDVVMLPQDRVALAVGDVREGHPGRAAGGHAHGHRALADPVRQCLPCEVVSHVNRLFWR